MAVKGPNENYEVVRRRSYDHIKYVFTEVLLSLLVLSPLNMYIPFALLTLL